MKDYGKAVRQCYSNASDEQLDTLVSRIKSNDKDCGEARLAGYLRAQGFRIQRERVRASLRRVDPEGTAERRLGLRWISRRRYRVARPNQIWHIDGHHKLIRWGFITHGGIDGFSRMTTFLKCSTDNEPVTVLDSFIHAVNHYGLPEKARSDRGGENIAVADFMLQYRGESGMITGRSVHNQRIERLWRDVFQNCSLPFYTLFYNLEDTDRLDADNAVHIRVLQFCFLRLYNIRLQRWRFAWNRHKIRTANNRTPLQMWLSQPHVDDHDVEQRFVTDDIAPPDNAPDTEVFSADMPQAVAQRMTATHGRLLATDKMEDCEEIYNIIVG